VPLQLLLINPNTSGQITEPVTRRARQVAPAGTVFDVATARFGARRTRCHRGELPAGARRRAVYRIRVPDFDALAEISPVPVASAS
jgi:Asp/Glu/hydantoin racemase